MTSSSIDPIVPLAASSPLLANVERMLAETTSDRLTLAIATEQIALPDELRQVLAQAVAALKRGEAVSVVPVAKELTTQQAADLLNVSRPFLIKLLDRGEIPYRRAGTHRRMDLEEVLRYRARRSALRLQLLAEMAHLAEADGSVLR